MSFRQSNIEYIRELIAGTPWQSDANAVEVADRFADTCNCRKEISFTRDVLNKTIDFDSPFQPRVDDRGRRRIGYGRAFLDALEQARAMSPMVEAGNIAAIRAVIDKISAEKRRLGEEGFDPKQLSYLVPEDLAAAIEHLGNMGVLAPSRHAKVVSTTAARHANEVAERLAAVEEITHGGSLRPILRYGQIASISASDLPGMSMDELRATLAETRRIRALRNETREEQKARLQREQDEKLGHRRYRPTDNDSLTMTELPTGETPATFVRGVENRPAEGDIIDPATGAPFTRKSLLALSATEFKKMMVRYGPERLTSIVNSKR